MSALYTQLMSIVYGIWRNRKIALLVAWGVTIVGWLVLAQIPNVYSSTARLHFDTDKVLTPLMSDLTVDNNIYSQILTLRETLLSRDNVELVIRGTNLKNLLGTEEELEENIEYHISSIVGGFSIQPESQTLFSMSYTDEDPLIAHGVVQGFIDAFIEGTLVNSSGELSGAISFIEQQISEMEEKLKTAEQAKSKFIQENMAFLSSTGQTYFQSLNAARKEATDVQMEIDELANQKQQIIDYREQLPPFVSSLGSAPLSGAQKVTIETRIASMVTQLDELFVRGYKEQHPDVKILREQISGLEQKLADERVNLQNALNNGDTSGLTSMEGLKPNPLFDQLSLKLIDVEGEIAKLEARKQQKEAVVDRLLKLSQRVPEVEAQEAQLNRDYEIILENYNALIDKREEAKMTQDLESTSNGIVYSLIEPPKVPVNPSSPNRLVIVLASMFAGIIAGCGVAFIMNQFHRKFSSEQQLRDTFNLPVLGSVSAIVSKKEEVLRKRNAAISIALFGGLFVVSIFVYIILERINTGVV